MIGILLHNEEYRANTLRSTWLHSDGLQVTFLRISTKKQTPTPPLFSTCELSLQRGNSGGDAAFISEWDSTRERPGLARPYRRLQAASYFAVFLRENAGILPDPEPIFELATTVFDSLETAPEPLAAIFKALYKTASLEGLPVKEDWLLRENHEVSILARDVLKNPLSSPILKSIPLTQLETLIRKLHSWLAHHTEFKLPNTPLA